MTKAITRFVLLTIALGAAATLAMAAAQPAHGSRALIKGIFDEAETIGRPQKTVSAAPPAPHRSGAREPLLERRRRAEAEARHRPGRPRLSLGRLRPARPERRPLQDQGRPGHRRYATLGERRPRQGLRAEEGSRPPQLRLRRRQAVQRHVHPVRGRGREALSGRAPLARMERAEQPGLPEAAVQVRRGCLADRERPEVRDHLQLDRGRDPCGDGAARREDRLRRHRASGEQCAEELAALSSRRWPSSER